MNVDALRRVAAGMVGVTEGETKKVRPLPGNELVLSRVDGRWRLGLRREEAPIAAEDVSAVALAFGVPGWVEPTMVQRDEMQTVSRRFVRVWYARWAW
jgi:hypothetical protein